MADYSDLVPAYLRPSVSDGTRLKPSITTSNYSGGTPSAADEVKPSLMYADGTLKESVADAVGLKASWLLAGSPRPPNTAPVASSVAFTGTEQVGETLTRTYSYSDADGDAEGVSTTQWYRADDGTGTNEAAISGATSSTYTLVSADEGKFIRVGVVPVAATGTSPGTEAFSSYSGAIAAAGTSARAMLANRQTQGTDGGSFTSGARRTATLNTEVYDPDGIVTLSSNQFTLGAGTYHITFRSYGYNCDGHKAWLYNVTDATDEAVSTSLRAAVSATGNNRVNGSVVVTIASSKTFELQKQCQTTRATDGLGLNANFDVEQYDFVDILQVA